MKNVKQSVKINLLSSSLLAIFVMLLMASCSKNIAGKTNQNSIEESLGSQPASQEKNGLATAPFDETIFVPCTNGGAGEDVALTGTTHFVYQIVWNDHGFHLVYHENSQGITGVGLSSGETFAGSDGTQGTVTAAWESNQWIGTTIEQMKIVGKNTRYIVRYKQHLVVTPDGKVTVSIKDKTVDCITK